MTDQKAAPTRFAREKKWSFFGALAALVTLFVLSRFATKTRSARTDASDSEARLHPRVYRVTLAKVAQDIRALVPRLQTYGRTWKLERRARQKENAFHIEVPVLFFTDDLTATLTPQDGGASTRVDVRSASRVGKSDFGENRRHIIRFLTTLDQRLK